MRKGIKTPLPKGYEISPQVPYRPASSNKLSLPTYHGALRQSAGMWIKLLQDQQMGNLDEVLHLRPRSHWELLESRYLSGPSAAVVGPRLYPAKSRFLFPGEAGTSELCSCSGLLSGVTGCQWEVDRREWSAAGAQSALSRMIEPRNAQGGRWSITYSTRHLSGSLALPDN